MRFVTVTATFSRIVFNIKEWTKSIRSEKVIQGNCVVMSAHGEDKIIKTVYKSYRSDLGLENKDRSSRHYY